MNVREALEFAKKEQGAGRGPEIRRPDRDLAAFHDPGQRIDGRPVQGRVRLGRLVHSRLEGDQ